MSKKRAFIFPGQGAQKVGMGKDFYDAYPIAKETFQEADDLLSMGLSKVVFEGPTEQLLRTDHCQLAIYVTSVAILRVVQGQFPQLAPAITAGLSLGEYGALTAAGKLAYKDALPLVKVRAEFMHAACLSSPGSMVAVMGLVPEEVQVLLDEMPGKHRVWMANLNCPGQIVMAGDKPGIEAACAFFARKGVKRVLRLDVAGAFHSPLMQEAKDRLRPYIEAAPLQASDVGVVMNNAKGEIVTVVDELRPLMIEQVTAPVYWEKGIRAMEAAGTQEYFELGPGKTLTGMNRKIGVHGKTYNVEKIEDLETLGEALHESALKE